MTIQSFIATYFPSPSCPVEASYNIINTLVYAVILVIAVFLIYKLLKKLGIPINREFFFATFPFILLGGLIRALCDAAVLKSFIFQTPFLYIVVFAIAFPTLVISFYIEKYLKIDYWKIMSAIGVGIIIFFSFNLRLKNPIGLMQILLLTGTSMLIIYGLGRFIPKILTKLNQFVLDGAMFDAFSTFIGVALYGYGEKHVLPSYLFSIFGPWVMIPLKFFVIFLVLWAIDNYEKDEFFRNFMKFAILCVTLGPGTRNTLRIAMGV